MSQGLGQVAVFLLAVVFANLPFLSDRIFFVKSPVASKGGWWRVVELITGYLIVGALGKAIEGNLGLVHSQNWEFYALTACLFLVLAFPGFVYRFMWRSPRSKVV